MTITIPEEHMRQMDISFCGKVATNIVTSDAKQIIINKRKLKLVNQLKSEIVNDAIENKNFEIYD